MRQAILRCALLGAITLVGGATYAAESSAIPRYRFEVGQELTYRGGNESKYEKNIFRQRELWKLWVVRANPDGSWRLIVQHGDSFSATSPEADDHKPAPEPTDFRYAWCDVYPDGRIVENPTLGFRMQPFRLLPKLPADEAAAMAGWETNNSNSGTTAKYRIAPRSEGDQVTIDFAFENPLDVIYGNEKTGHYAFDLKRGLVEKLDSVNKQTFGFVGSTQEEIKLDDIQSRGAPWAEEFATDADQFFAAQKAAESFKKQASETSDEAEAKAFLDKAKASLTGIAPRLKSAELREAIDRALKEHDQMSRYYLDASKERAKLLSQPAATWATTDLEGKSHALKDYQGSVVILDFWYRGCGWCIRAMPQVKQVAQHFSGRPVVVFGVNTDKKDEDAQFVIDKMELSYPNLKGKEIADAYEIQGFPTLLILDQQGVVRDVHVGYAPDLKEQVVASVEKLLSTPTGAKP